MWAVSFAACTKCSIWSHDLRSPRPLYKGQSMFDVPSEETFFRRCKEIKVTHLKLEALEVILMHIQEYISRKESVRPRISSAVFRSFNKLVLILYPHHIKLVLSWKSCEYNDRCQSSKAWKRGMIQSTLHWRYHSRPWLFRKAQFREEAFQDFQHFPIHSFDRSICLMNISCHEVMVLILEMSALVIDMVQS